MKILGICATNAPKRKSTGTFLFEEALSAAREKGADAEAIRLTDYNMHRMVTGDNVLSAALSTVREEPQGRSLTGMEVKE